MKNIILGLLLLLNGAFAIAATKEITAEVVFENATGQELNSGEFYITELNTRIAINTTTSFKITLPAAGKYQFGFITKEFGSQVTYPERITLKNNTITIRLVPKIDIVLLSNNVPFTLNFDHKPSEDQMEHLFTAGRLNFIVHGLDAKITDEFIAFKNKFGVGIRKENCVVDPISFRNARENNRIIAEFLAKRQGNSWFNELPIKPIGLK